MMKCFAKKTFGIMINMHIKMKMKLHRARKRVKEAYLKKTDVSILDSGIRCWENNTNKGLAKGLGIHQMTRNCSVHVRVYEGSPLATLDVIDRLSDADSDRPVEFLSGSGVTGY